MNHKTAIGILCWSMVTRHKTKYTKRQSARQDMQVACPCQKKHTKLSRDKSSLSVKPPIPAKTVDTCTRGFEALSTTMLAMDEAKEARDVASSTPVAHEAHFVLVPQPSTHPRDPLVCDEIL